MTIGVTVPAEPIPPAGMKITGFMVHTNAAARSQAGYDADTLPAAVRLLLLHGVKSHAVWAFAGTDAPDELPTSCQYEPATRRWSSWGHN